MRDLLARPIHRRSQDFARLRDIRQPGGLETFGNAEIRDFPHPALRRDAQ